MTIENKNGGENHLQAWRERLKMTQEELAVSVGTTGAVISLLESGDRGLSAKWLRRLAPALKIRPGWLLDYHPDQIPDDVLETWQQIPADAKPQALTVLKTFRKVS